MKKIYLTVAFVSLCMAAVAQTNATTTKGTKVATRVEGTLKDSLKNETEPYATIRVFKEGQMSKPVAMSITGANGEISQPVEGKGTFVMVISSVGKKEVHKTFTLLGQQTLNLGNVYTADDTKQLGEVQVVSQKPIVKMDADKMTYDVSSDGDSKALTVLEMLRKVPMVTVDAQDNITVNGSSSFKILVDGKPNIQMQSNAKQILKALPASAVEKIEVNTNPGAKYDAEGVGGVLNLVFNHEGGKGSNSANGYNGEISANYNTLNDYGMSAFIAGQQKKFSYNINVYNDREAYNDCKVAIERKQTTSLADQTIPDIVTNSNSSLDQEGFYRGGTLDLGYDIDSLNVVHASVGMNYFKCFDKQYPVTTAISGRIYGNGFSYDSNNYENERSIGVNASADWQHFFNKEHTHTFTLSYMFSTSPNRDKYERLYTGVTGTPAYDLTDSYSDNHTRATEHTVQADYTLPVSESQTLNIGAKYSGRNNHVNSSNYYVDNNTNTVGNYTTPSTSLLHDNNQHIVAGYVEHIGSYGKWSSREGLRYEHTFASIEYPNLAEQNFKKNYGNLVPSATLSYHITQSANLALTYSMRIMRPGISYLNPYRDDTDPTSVEYGNPDLAVEKANYINLVFNYYAQKFMMNATLSQSFCNNQIASYSFNDENGRYNTTYGNNVKNRWSNFNTWMRVMATKSTSIMLNGYVGYGDIRSEQLECKNYGWQASATLMLEQMLPLKIKWNLGMQTSTRHYDIQGYDSGMNVAYTVFTRSFLKDKLNVFVMGLTPLADRLEQKSYRHGIAFENTQSVKVNIRSVQLGVSFTFGNTSKQFAKHQSKISNDFGESESKGLGGGIGGGKGKDE